MSLYLVGFRCYNYWSGCECNIDTPERVKKEFKRKYGFDHDEYCLYDRVIAENEAEALKLAYAQCGAAEEETIRAGFPEVEIIRRMR